ncbi:MAG TPA: HAMP domain-containing sensor histidine kinase [Thermoanaerobaculales bacterium]|nr:HAMP domain-containing sensor histidine kinase [Thermoanaerobaculales bacterium]HPA79743.1 HAMP domain-containing sensor histidine kinase [Thermoanaerobaculales bacterium]HQL29391.1 HAMP domain-containing sensor histidine kinase [Thermoanaerobaculales bacterium]HQN96073.1 HAMP domain-containing sensor histidine kinase [Thermoanaerobaculales bacterium]HQP42693.1 HAMP domain-containing sensor histidine kinase [Thermoanaerobaculales bacterium]
MPVTGGSPAGAGSPAGSGRGARRPELLYGDRLISRTWTRRALWQVSLRWWVPPAIVLALAVSWWLGFRVEVRPILTVAVGILLYNIPFAVASVRARAVGEDVPSPDRLYALLQVALDYAAVFLLVHFTGGAASPLIFFFLPHVVFAAILFRASTAYLFAGVAAGGMALEAIAEGMGFIDSHPLLFRGQTVNFLDSPGHVAAQLTFFAASVLIVAVAAAQIMASLRKRVIGLAESRDEIAALNQRLSSTYTVLTVLGSETDLRRVLDLLSSSLAEVMQVRGVSVKLLDEDGKALRYVAVHGLPQEFLAERVVEIARNPLNRRVIEGETLVTGEIGFGSPSQEQEALARLGIRSVTLAPLKVHNRVTGILGAYSDRPDSFSPADADFLRLAAELSAIAIDHARRHAEVQRLLDERLQFMFRVAHNMRAPLAAGVSMLHLLREGYLDSLTQRQVDHLDRVIRRLRGLDTGVGEVLTLARDRLPGMSTRHEPLDLGELAARVDAHFREQAAERRLTLRLTAADGLPLVSGDPHQLEQVLENLVSNALKYTPAGGEVEVALDRSPAGGVVLTVRDTGIGIPKEEQGRLFSEFFRASNARRSDEPGTGLGLRIVQDVVEKHGGQVRVQSEEGRGTLVTVELPAPAAGPPD